MNPAYTFGKPGPYPRGQWHFTSSATQPGSRARWYVDGNQVASQPRLPTSGLTATSYLGNRGDLGRDFDGRIDDLQIYNTPVRPAMVQALMANPGKTLNDVFRSGAGQRQLRAAAADAFDEHRPGRRHDVAADPASWSRGWSDFSTGTSDSVYHLLPGGETGSGLKSNGGYFYDMTDGDQGVGLILRSAAITESWVFQSLGTITAEDSRHDVHGHGRHLGPGPGRRSFQRRTAHFVPQRRQRGSQRRASACWRAWTCPAPPGSPAATTRSARWSSWFRPTADDIGKEIFLVVSVFDATPAGGSDQYQFDNVTLSVVPEPATWMLAVLGFAGFLAAGRRRRTARSRR